MNGNGKWVEDNQAEAIGLIILALHDVQQALDAIREHQETMTKLMTLIVEGAGKLEQRVADLEARLPQPPSPPDQD